MVFPGGGREVNKRKNERYKLVWKNRLGFARLAIQHAYPIVPFASVGAEHGIDIVLDTDSPLMAPTQFLADKLLGMREGPPWAGRRAQGARACGGCDRGGYRADARRTRTRSESLGGPPIVAVGRLINTRVAPENSAL